jgi:hypothetical protein
MATSKKKKKRGSAATPTARAQASRPKAPGEQRHQGVPSTSTAQIADVNATEEDDAEFEAEYSYVRRDLRHLSVISLVLFAVMFVIGFVI